jgi:hemerythrin-like domain-containing protein
MNDMTRTHTDPTAVIETRVVHDVHRAATSLLATADVEHAYGIEALAELRRFVTGTLRHHHHGEDADLWPLLARQEPALTAGLRALSAEHAELDTTLDALDSAPIDDDLGALRARAETLRDIVHEHLAHEEPFLFPALREHVSDEAWDEFSQRMVTTSPPEGNHLMLAFLDRVASPAEVDLVLRDLPAEAREHFPAMRAQAAATLAALR